MNATIDNLNETEEEKARKMFNTMASYAVVEHAVYTGAFMINATALAKFGTSSEDLSMFYEGLVEAYESSVSAHRTGMRIRRITVADYSTARGNFPSHVLCDMMEPRVKNARPTEWGDYDIPEIDPSKLPPGMVVAQWVDGVVRHIVSDAPGAAVERQFDSAGFPVHTTTRKIVHLVVECVRSNPNGDPAKNGDPRQDSNGRGWASAASLKMKIRSYVEQTFGKAMYLSMGSDLGVAQDKHDRDPRKMLVAYWDMRVFGGTTPRVAARHRLQAAPVHLSDLQSVASITSAIDYVTGTRVAGNLAPSADDSADEDGAED